MRPLRSFLTRGLGAQDVGKGDVLEPVRFSDIIVILGKSIIPTCQQNTEVRFSQESKGNLLSYVNCGRHEALTLMPAGMPWMIIHHSDEQIENDRFAYHPWQMTALRER